MSNEFLAALAQADQEHANVQAAEGFALHPECTCIGEVETARIEKKNDGNLQLFVKFKTEHGHPAVWQQLTGFKSDSQVAFTKKVLLHLGHEGGFAELANSTAHLIGRKVELQIKHDLYEGKKMERVYTNGAVEGSDLTTNADTSAFAAQFNATQVDQSLPANFGGEQTPAQGSPVN